MPDTKAMKREPQTSEKRREIVHIDNRRIDSLNDTVMPEDRYMRESRYPTPEPAGKGGAVIRDNEKRRGHRGVVILVIILLVIAAGLAGLYLYTTGGLRRVSATDDEFGIESQDADISQRVEGGDDIENIVFLGIDRQENRSDVMMILSVNKTRKTMKVISLLRDSRVDIEGHAPTKLGYAYKWGGSVFAVRTINRNFHTDFNQFITMNFENVAEIVDTVGGVDIELTLEEAVRVNRYSHDIEHDAPDVTEGWNRLNGAQAVAYSRIRDIDSEYYRAGRQQAVIEAMFSAIKNMPVTNYIALAHEVLGSMETTLTIGDMMSIIASGPASYELIRYTIPDENFETDLFGGWVDNPDGGPEEDPVQWLWVYDLDAASERLKSIIYGEAY